MDRMFGATRCAAPVARSVEVSTTSAVGTSAASPVPRRRLWLLDAPAESWGTLGRMPVVPYRIETARLVVRCFRPEDAAMRKAAVDASAEHLARGSIRWATEPASVSHHLARARTCRGMFDLDQDYLFAICEPGEQRLLGEIGLLSRAGPAARELGYWVRVEEAGKGVITEAAASLVRVSFELLELERVDIHCGVGNGASARVAHKLGFVLDGTLRHRRVRPEDEAEDNLSFSMLVTDYRKSPANNFPLKAFDAMGVSVL
ncbi:MAG: N-acetyltransferase [Myxococcales bacterium]|nr:N-acetyltransferase [Myxococcales bacterium]